MPTPEELAARLLARFSALRKAVNQQRTSSGVTPEDFARKLKAKLVSPVSLMPSLPVRQQAPAARQQAPVVRQQAPARQQRDHKQPWIAFASGLTPPQLYGFAEIGRGVGFSLATKRNGISIDLGKKAWKDYLDVIDRMYDEISDGFRLLVDNGAVQEVDLETMTSAAPISDATWKKRMDRYVELAMQADRALARDASGWLPNGVWLITPDRIGDQRETIRRFTLCAPQLRETVRLGAVLVLTLQPGEMGPVELEARLRALLPGTPDRQIVPAFPMRRRGDDRRLTVTPLPVLLDFLRQRRPHTVHLLGMGLKSKLLPGILRQIHEASSGTKVTLDSADVRAVAVPGRPWIEQKPWAEALIRRRAPYHEQVWPQIDTTMVLSELDSDGLRAAGESAGLTPECLERFVRDPEGTYSVIAGWNEDDEEHPCMESGIYDPRELDAALEEEWLRRDKEERFIGQSKFPPSAGAAERDRMLVHRVFGGRDKG